MADTFRALCQELMDAIDSGIPVERIKQSPLAVRVDAALAQPEPHKPSESELKTFACTWWHSFGFVKDKATCTWVIDHVAPEHFVDFSRDVLARWGRPAIEPMPGAKGE